MKVWGNDLAVSNTLGAVFLVGVIAIGVAGVGVYELSQTPPAETPALHAVLENQSEVIILKHSGGETLDRANMKLTVSSSGSTGSEDWINYCTNQYGSSDWTTFSNGDTLYCHKVGSMPNGVQLLYTGATSGVSNAYLIATNFKGAGNLGNQTSAVTPSLTTMPSPTVTEVTPSPTATQNATPSVTPTPTSTPTSNLTPVTSGAYASPNCIWPYRWHHWDYWDHGYWDNHDYYNNGCYKYYDNFAGNISYYNDNGYWDQGYHPYNKFVRITIQNVTNPGGGPVTIRIINVTQDEPVDNNGDGFHARQPDAFIWGSNVYVRAECNPYGDGRVYRIAYEAVNSQGGKSPGFVEVKVLHDWSDHGTCTGVVDSGQYYDSTLSRADPVTVSASFTSNVTSGTAPLDVQFVDTSTGSTITGWSWSFGDGTYSNIQNPVHTYTSSGTYRVSLSASGPFSNDTDTIPGYITVTQGTIPTSTTPVPAPSSADHLYLWAAKGSYLKSGTYLQFRNGNSDTTMELNWQSYSFNNNTIVRIMMDGDQKPAACSLYATNSIISGLSGIKANVQVSDTNGNPLASYSGTLTGQGISVSKYNSYQSTLTLVVPSESASTIFYADGSPVISSPDNNQKIAIYNLAPDSSWGLYLAYTPGSTYLAWGSGSYQIG